MQHSLSAFKVLYLFGHHKASSSKIQGSTLDVLTAFEIVKHVKGVLANERLHNMIPDAFDNADKMLVMVKIASLPSIEAHVDNLL